MSAGERDATDGARRPRGRRRVRRFVVRPLVWLAVLVALAVAGLWFFAQSDTAHRRVRRLVEARLTELFAQGVEIAEVDWSFVPLSFVARGVVIPAAAPPAAIVSTARDFPPFATVDEVRVDLTLRGWRRPELDIDRVTLVRPVVELVLYPGGSSSFPELQLGEGGGGRVEVRLGSVAVERGVFRFAERELPFELEAEGVWGRLTGPPGPLNAGGEPPVLGLNLVAHRLLVELPEARPYAGSLLARGTVTAGRLDLAAARFAAPEVTVRADGRVSWDDQGTAVGLAIDASGSAAIVNRLGYLDDPLGGRFDFAGAFELGADAWSWHGNLASPALEYAGHRFTDLAARVEGDAARVQVDLERGGWAGGRAAGTLVATLGSDPLPLDLDLTVTGAGLAPLVAELGLDPLPATGRVDAELTYRFTSAALLEGSGWGTVAIEAVERRPGAVPVAGEATLAIERGVVSSEAVRLTAPGQRLTGEGSLDLSDGRGRFAFTLVSDDLGLLTPLVPLAADPELAPWLPIAGRGTAQGDLTFGPLGIAGPLTLDLERPAVELLAVDRLSGSLRLTPDAVEEMRLEATLGGGALLATGGIAFAPEAAPRGRPAATAATSTSAGPPLSLAFDAADWPLESLGALFPEAVAGLEPAGPVTGSLTLGGTTERLSGRAELTATPLTLAGIVLDRVDTALEFGPERVEFERLVVASAAGEATAGGVIDLASGTLDLEVRADDLDLGDPALAERVPGDLDGRVTLAATVGGTLESPRVAVEIEARELTLAGRHLGDDGSARLAATWDGRAVEADGSLLGLIGFTGGGELDRERAELSFALASEQLAELVELGTGVALAGLTGEVSGALTIEGALGGVEPLSVGLTLDRLVATYEGHRVENLEPVALRLDGERLIVDSLYLGEQAGPARAAGEPSELFVAGEIGFGGEEAELALNLQSSLAAAWAELFLPDLEVDGVFEVLATVRGTVSEPRINGQGEIRGGRLILAGFPHALDDLTATVLFYPEQVVLDSLAAELAGGDVRAAGRVGLASLAEGEIDYRFQASATDVSVRYPEGFLLRGDANLTLVSTADGRELVGSIDLERAFYLEDVPVGLTQLLRGALQRQRLDAGETDPELAATQLNLNVRGPDALRVRNNVANLSGDLDLVIRGSVANPAMFGRVEIDRGGTLVYADNTYEVERGLLTFANPYRIDPVIDLVATTDVRDYDVTLQLSGTVDRLDATFVSDPPLADLDVLALLTTGRPLGEGQLFGDTAGAESQAGAQTFLYGQAASVISERVNTLFGFDRFRVNPVVGTAGEGSSVAFTVGKQLSRDLYVTYSQDPSSSLDYLLQAEWQVSESVTLVLTQNGDRSFAVDVRWEKRF